jgi:CBS domain-containing protein
MTRVGEIMTRSVATVNRDETLQAAAKRMRELDVGSLPVVDGRTVVGIVTDRDIVVRGVAENLAAHKALVVDVMTADVRWCREDDSVDEVMAEMGDAKVRRIPVLNVADEIVGIVALADVATRQSSHTDQTLREISTPGR